MISVPDALPNNRTPESLIQGNVITSPDIGIPLFGNASGTEIIDNYIGTDQSGIADLGMDVGIKIILGFDGSHFIPQIEHFKFERIDFMLMVLLLGNIHPTLVFHSCLCNQELLTIEVHTIRPVVGMNQLELFRERVDSIVEAGIEGFLGQDFRF